MHQFQVSTGSDLGWAARGGGDHLIVGIADWSQVM